MQNYAIPDMRAFLKELLEVLEVLEEASINLELTEMRERAQLVKFQLEANRVELVDAWEHSCEE